jgi:serine/threonine protein kinase
VHRDLKPENLLLSDPSDTAILKIADFGLSAVIFASEAAQPEMESASTTPNKHVKEQTNNSKTSSSKSPQHSTVFSTPSRNLSAQIDNSPASLRRLKSVVGSPHYIAPEIANGGNPSAKN